jgi:YVTN family beta-propeller protein
MAELPSGAVTFLFTDIEGSTQLVKQLRDRYGSVLAEHQRLLREAFVAHGGHEIDTQGDAFFIAFASAREAVLAAVEGQRALSGYPWPDNTPVRVRMGIHTGQAVPVDGRYTGVAVHRAARICAAGHGGQVLVSQATQTLIEDEEEDLAVGLRDLGDQRLKDLDRPVRLYQVGAPGLSAQFPPLRREAEPTEVVTPRRRGLSPRIVWATVIGAVLVAVPVVALLVSRGGGGGLSGVSVNHVGLIDPASDEIVDEVQVGVQPGPVAADTRAVWVGNGGSDRSLTRIDPKTREVVATPGLDNRTPTGIAVGQGAVWVANGLYQEGSLQRVDPQFGVTETLENASAGAVTIGAGAVWGVNNSTLKRINPSTVQSTGEVFTGSGPNSIGYGEGALWVANGGDATVWRFNPSTFESGRVRDPYSVGSRPIAIAVGEDAVWVANAGDDNVSRIDPASNGVTSIPVGDGPTAIAVGEGAVWVANSDGTISKIDPETQSMVDSIEIGNYPAGIAVGAGYVWVTVQTP